MAFNSVAFKKSMLAWGAIAKKAPDDVKQFGKAIVAEHPEAAQPIAAMAKQISAMNVKLHDLLDKVVNAKDDKGRESAAKNALGEVKHYQSYVSSTHLPPTVQTNLKKGLAELAKGLGG